MTKAETDIGRVLADEAWEFRDYSPDTRDWLWCQFALNGLLSQLVNGETLARPKVLSVIYRYGSPRVDLWRAELTSPPLGARGKRLVGLLGERFVTAAGLLRALGAMTDVLMRRPRELAVSEDRKEVSPVGAAVLSDPVVHALCGAVRPLGDLVSVHLHGSRATGDTTSFSDTDDLVLLRASAWHSETAFRAVISHLEHAARVLQRFDPLQHHGHIVFTEFDLLCLDEGLLPLAALDTAVTIAGRPSVTAHVWSSRRGLARALWNLIHEVKASAAYLDAQAIRLYDLKKLVSGISLLPALTLQVNGERLDKRTGLSRATEVFSPGAINAIKWASLVRSRWSECPGVRDIARLGGLIAILRLRRGESESLARAGSRRIAAETVPFLERDTRAAVKCLLDESLEHLWPLVASLKA